MAQYLRIRIAQKLAVTAIPQLLFIFKQVSPRIMVNLREEKYKGLCERRIEDLDRSAVEDGWMLRELLMVSH